MQAQEAFAPNIDRNPNTRSARASWNSAWLHQPQLAPPSSHALPLHKWVSGKSPTTTPCFVPLLVKINSFSFESVCFDEIRIPKPRPFLHNLFIAV